MKENARNIITRKIRLFIDIPKENKEELSAAYQKLFDWRNMAYRASNLVATNLYIQDQSKELIYFHDDIKLKLADRSKDEQGILNTSRENSTYRILSRRYKNEIPAAVFSSINRSVYKNYISEKNDYFFGEKSLRSYKKNMPIPISPKFIYNLRYVDEIKNFRLTLFKDEKYKVPFKTFLGSDRGNKKIIIERCTSGEYKLCESKLKVEDKRIFLYLTVEMPKLINVINPKTIATAKLSFMAPLTITINEKEYPIGDKDSFIHKRLAINEGLKRRQHLMKYNSGGKGRSKKTQGIEEFKEKERNFIETYMHQLSSEIVKFCIEHKAGKLLVDNTDQSFEEAKEYPFVLRNWSYGNLLQKLEYKSNKNSIDFKLI